MAGETSPTFYDLLHVARSASTDEIRTAYRRLARENHPDVAPHGGDAMAGINQAYEVLSDPERRARYDEGLAMRPPEPRRPGRVELPAHRERQRLLWVAAGSAVALVVVAGLLLGLRSTEEAMLPPAGAGTVPPKARGAVVPAAEREEGLQLIPSRTIQRPPHRDDEAPSAAAR